MATYTWVRNGVGSWIVTGNWSHGGIGGVPVAGADILFNGTLSTTVTYSVSTTLVYNSLTLDDPNATESEKAMVAQLRTGREDPNKPPDVCPNCKTNIMEWWRSHPRK